MLPPAPWWARFLVTLALLALAARMIVGQEQLAIAGAIVGVVGAHWLPSAGHVNQQASSKGRDDG